MQSQNGGVKADVGKPVFLTKKQREELKRKEEEEVKKKEEDRLKEIESKKKHFEEKALQALMNQETEKKDKEPKGKADHEKEGSKSERRPTKFEHSSSRDQKDSKKDRRNNRNRNDSEESRGSRSRSRSRSQEKFKTSNTRASVPTDVDNGENAELQNIKATYLGLNKGKRKHLKPSEKFRNIFNFEWDDREDTSKDINPLYAKKHEGRLLFGKGHLGGIDPEVQNKAVPGQEGKGKRDPSERHWSQKAPHEMTDRDWRIFREDNDIIIKGGRVPNPMRSWDEALLPVNLVEVVKSSGYKQPTPIQIQALPIGLERRDLIGIAPTGSGKSAAFLLPLIAFLQTLPPITHENQAEGPYALILTPTRDLAQQLATEFKKFAEGTNLRCAVIVGGKSLEAQVFQLRRGCECVIGTPGRLQEAIEGKYMVLNQCCWVIFDEADRMVIEHDYEESIHKIMEALPSNNLKGEDEGLVELQEKMCKEGQKIYRVGQMFSATMPSAVERLVRKYLRYPAYISIGEPGGGKKEIEQRVEMISEQNKKYRLKQILEESDPPIIVFSNSKHGVDVLYKILTRWGFKCVQFHGGKNQEQRENAIESFKKKKYDVLLATDLAGRGLDVEGVKQVINFDAPKSIQDYVHRIGRTGRAGKKGLATTFLTNNDDSLFYDLVKFLEMNNQPIPPELFEHPGSKVKQGSTNYTLRRKDQVILAQ